MLTLAFYLHCLLSVCAAVCFADLLVQPGMLLAPVQRWLRERHKWLWMRGYADELFDACPPAEPGEATHQKWARCNESAEQAFYDLGSELDSQFWWKPLWGCPTCVAGWWALIAYAVHYHGPAYRLDEHIYFVALGLLLSLLIQWIIRRLHS